jgi:hypothetical protein
MSGDLWNIVVAAGQVIAVITISSLALLALLVGFSLGLGFPKLRRSGAGTLTVRSLDESLGQTARFLPPTAPRGPADQLATPELMEGAARKSQ